MLLMLLMQLDSDTTRQSAAAAAAAAQGMITLQATHEGDVDAFHHGSNCGVLLATQRQCGLNLQRNVVATCSSSSSSRNIALMQSLQAASKHATVQKLCSTLLLLVSAVAALHMSL
jgi:hypothetical protein